MNGWSAPDKHGVCEQRLDVGAKSTLHGKRLRQAFPPSPQDPGIWPVEWRELLVAWIKSGGTRRKWDSLIKLAGHARVNIAHDLLSALVNGGWAALTEETSGRGHWQTTWVEFLQLPDLRRLLGLPDPQEMTCRLQQLLAHPVADSRLQAAIEALSDLPTSTALVRLELLRALDRWVAEQRFGTRRDFALYARDGTKAISEAEWNWLEAQLDLSGFGIERHTPALWLRAPLLLHTAGGVLDIQAVPDCIGLTPATLFTLTRIEGTIAHWRIVENRTSFERVARQSGTQDAVLWLPGFPPSWWLEAAQRLVALCPAPAIIACDPDPAGIEIALNAATVWESAGLVWQPWGMCEETLKTLPARQSLNDNDRHRLHRLLQADLSPALREFAGWMLAHNLKGEQEGAI